MMIVSRRHMLTLAASAAVVGSTGCFASFGATTTLWNFNNTVSGNKWVNWLVFLVLTIVPVYALFVLGDVLIFNTIEFFTGSNPLASTTRDLGYGNAVAYQRDEHDPSLVRLEHRRDGEIVGIYYVKKDGDNFSLLDRQRKTIAQTSENNGTVTVRDGHGNIIEQLDPEAMRTLKARSLATGSVVGSLRETLGEERILVASSGSFQRI